MITDAFYCYSLYQVCSLLQWDTKNLVQDIWYKIRHHRPGNWWKIQINATSDEHWLRIRTSWHSKSIRYQNPFFILTTQSCLDYWSSSRQWRTLFVETIDRFFHSFIRWLVISLRPACAKDMQWRQSRIACSSGTLARFWPEQGKFFSHIADVHQ